MPTLKGVSEIVELKTLKVAPATQLVSYLLCLLLLGSQSPAGRIEENNTCAPDPFNIFVRDIRSLLIFQNPLIAALFDPT